MSAVVIACDEVTVEVGETVLLAPTTLAVESGELVCVTGPNGSGKTTLLRTFLGSLTPSGGTCSLMGEPVDLSQPRQRRRLGSLVEPLPLARDMTLAEQAAVVAASWFGNSAQAAERTDSVTSSLELTALLDRFPHQLSAGQLQLFSLALVLLRPADALLLDEPEQHLDHHRIHLLAEALTRRAAAGVAIVAATHDTTLAAAADRRLRCG